jgi:mRNA interferase MazF
VSQPHRAEIWWANIPQPVGRRPVLILTRDQAISSLNSVTVAPLTRSVRGIPTEAPLGPKQGLPTACAASLDNLQTLPKTTLDKRLAKLDLEQMKAVATAIHVALDLPF